MPERIGNHFARGGVLALARVTDEISIDVGEQSSSTMTSSPDLPCSATKFSGTLASNRREQLVGVVHGRRAAGGRRQRHQQKSSTPPPHRTLCHDPYVTTRTGIDLAAGVPLIWS